MTIYSFNTRQWFKIMSQNLHIQTKKLNSMAIYIKKVYIRILKGFGKIQTKFLTLTILGNGEKQNGEEGIRKKRRTFTLYTLYPNNLIFLIIIQWFF